MAQVPTLCEISYDFDIFTDRSDNFYTPYRLSLSSSRQRSIGIPSDQRSARCEKNLDLIHYTFFGQRYNLYENYERYPTRIDTSRSKYQEDFYQETSSYYDFLRDYYIAKSSSPTQSKPMCRGDTVTSPQLPQQYHLTVPQEHVLPSLGKYSPYGEIDENELNFLPGLSRTGLKGKDLTHQKNDDTLTWVDSLNAWISTKKCSEEKPYISIVNNPPYIEKCFTVTQCRYKRDAGYSCKGQCDRYHNHMLTFEEINARRSEQKNQLNPRLKHYRNAVLERVNRKETRRQRKAYSTPLYNSNVHTCRRKSTPLSAGACQAFDNKKIDKNVDNNIQMNEDEKEEKKEEENNEDKLIQKLTEVFGKDTFSPNIEKDVEIETSCSNRRSSDSLSVQSGLYDQVGLDDDIICSISNRSSSIISQCNSLVWYIPAKGSGDVSWKCAHDDLDNNDRVCNSTDGHTSSSRSFTENSSQLVKNVSEEVQTKKKISSFLKKELTVLVRKERKSPRKTRVEAKPSHQYSVKLPKKIEKFTVKVPSLPTKPRPKIASGIASWAAPPKVELKSQEATSSLSILRKEEKKERRIFSGKEKEFNRNTSVKKNRKNLFQLIKKSLPVASSKNKYKSDGSGTSRELRFRQSNDFVGKMISSSSEIKALIPEFSSTESRPLSVTLPENDFTPPPEYLVSTLVTHVDKPSEVDVKTEEDNSMKQTNKLADSDKDAEGKDAEGKDVDGKDAEGKDVEGKDVEGKDAEGSKRRRSHVRKREKILRLKTENEIKELPPEPKVEGKKQSSWIYGDDGDDTLPEQASTPVGVKYEVSALPTTPSIPQVPTEIPRKQPKCHIVNKHLVQVEAKPRWGNKKYDKSYDEERRRAELAERRRKRQMDMYEKLKLHKSGKQTANEEVKEYASFDEYDFLAKYCIFYKTKRDMIQHAFDIVDEDSKGWLNGEDVMVALRIVNSKLTETEKEYLSRIIEMTGYKITDGADFKLFSVLSALSTRISRLDSWMKNMIGTMDFKTLEMKLFMCKTLWECNVDHETNTIPLEQVMIELRAGGVSYEHECEVKKKLGHLKALDLFDFLTYVPLFIMIHEAVIYNPLDESRIK